VRRSFLTNTSFVGFSQISSVAAAILISIVLARYLGPAGKGQVALAMGVSFILGQILSLGFDSAAPYFIASGKLRSQQGIGGCIVTFVLGNTIAFAVVYPLLITYLANNVFAGVDKNLLLFASLGCPLYMMRVLINGLMSAHEEFGKQTYHNCATYMMSILAALLSLVFLNLGIIGYVKLNVALGCCAVIYGLILLKRITSLSPEFNISIWLKMLRYGAKSTLSQIFRLIDLRLDIFIVNYFAETSVVGIYTVAAALAGMFGILSSSISFVLLPKTAASDRQQANTRTAALCRNALCLTVTFGLLFLIVSKKLIVWMYTESFAGAALAFALLMPGVAGQAVARICLTDCSARGFPEKATYSTAISALLTIGFDLYLIPKYGIYGAAIASSIAYCTGGVLGLFWHIKLSGNHLSSLIVPQKSDLKYYRSIMDQIRTKRFV